MLNPIKAENTTRHLEFLGARYKLVAALVELVALRSHFGVLGFKTCPLAFGQREVLRSHILACLIKSKA